jgi:hypothetical protein
MEGQGGEAQGVADPPRPLPPPKKTGANTIVHFWLYNYNAFVLEGKSFFSKQNIFA